MSKEETVEIWYCPSKNYLWTRWFDAEGGYAISYPSKNIVGKRKAINPEKFNDVFIGYL